MRHGVSCPVHIGSACTTAQLAIKSTFCHRPVNFSASLPSTLCNFLRSRTETHTHTHTLPVAEQSQLRSCAMCRLFFHSTKCVLCLCIVFSGRKFNYVEQSVLCLRHVVCVCLTVFCGTKRFAQCSDPNIWHDLTQRKCFASIYVEQKKNFCVSSNFLHFPPVSCGIHSPCNRVL